MTDDSQPRTPGQLIQELLNTRGWTQQVLAIVLGEDPTGLNKIIAGKRPLTAELALSLGELFDTPPERFLDLQKAYELAHARLIVRPDPSRATRAQLFGSLPIAEMIKRGWLETDNVRDAPKVETALAKFFGATTAAEIELLPHAAKKTNADEQVTPVQLAWLYRVRKIASEMIVPKYSAAALRKALPQLLELRSAVDELRQVPKILAESGLRFLLVESLTGAKIDGVCFWLDDNSPVIAMTMRYDRVDNFWFVLRHEIEHVLRGHGKDEAIVDANLEGDRAGVGESVSTEERIANEAAAEFCVPQSSMKQFVDRKAPFFAERDILGFARTLRIHPGLVAGQIQHRTKRYDCFRKHLVKVRFAVAPSALVDGWGDIVPVDS